MTVGSEPLVATPAAGGRLWAVAAYFNPVGYRRRLANYRMFRRHLRVPLATVELARSADAFQLSRGDADILVQLTGEDRLWQKERLLNLAVDALPAACEQVAWLDCDVVFADPDWPARLSAALEVAPLAQAFERFYEVRCDTDTGVPDADRAIGGGVSATYRLASGMSVEQLFAPRLGNRLQRGSTVGLAWAARRELLDRHGLYDACVLGSGDKAMMCAALGRYEFVVSLDMNERQFAHYRAWAQAFFADVRGHIGYAPATVYHLWHGDLQHRQHRHRHREFQRFGFDPYLDVTRDAAGVWAWNSAKPEMHAYVRDYFASRREDG